MIQVTSLSVFNNYQEGNTFSPVFSYWAYSPFLSNRYLGIFVELYLQVKT